MSNERSITPLPPADFTPERGNYITLQPFRYWCQKVLPLVYDDSLSYYELLCKVVDYLNKAMEDIETLNEDVTNVFDAYNELQQYVNDYFTNLDVQEEINNKLNKMALDGTLSSLIAPYVISNMPPIVVNSTNDMTDRHKLYILSTNGHLYQWDSTSNNFVDTGLIYNTVGNYLSVREYISEGNLNDVAPNTVIAISYPGSGQGFINLPAEHAGYLVTYQLGDNVTARMQLFYDYIDGTNWFRQRDINGNWSAWVHTTALKDGGIVGSSGDTNYTYSNVRNMNDAPANTLICLNSPLTDGTSYLNTPNNMQIPAYVYTYQFGNNEHGRIQIYRDYFTGNSWHRACSVNNVWTPWCYDTISRDGGIVGSSFDTNAPYASVRNMNNAPVNTLISLNAPLSDGTVYENTPNNAQESAYVLTWKFGTSPSAKIQFYWNYTKGEMWKRVCDVNGSWSVWTYDTALRNGSIVGSSHHSNAPYVNLRDMNNAPINTLVSLNAPLTDGSSYTNTPNNSQEPAYIITYQFATSDRARLQFYYEYATGKGYYRTCDVNGVWSAWKNSNVNYTQNTYNVTAYPNITTDNHGWLASTGDNTDRTTDIMTMLTTIGYCHLGEGTFYVNNTIEMPENSTLIGCGNKSIIKAISGFNNAVVVPTDNCTIKNLKIEGNGTASLSPTNEKGIYIYDTKTGFNDESTHGYRRILIDGVWINRFGGSGIEISGTGGMLTEGAIISNCHIDNCSIGINISFFSEYHKITACVIGFNNYIGVINNGGNNSFVNCTISGADAGFVIDNSNNNLPNHGHGTCDGCCFNHTGNNTGDGIRIIGVKYGFLFSSCQWWHSVIRITNTVGVLFDGVLGGGTNNKIIVTGSRGITFNDMLLSDTPEITSTNNLYLRFNDCFNSTTGAAISA